MVVIAFAASREALCSVTAITHVRRERVRTRGVYEFVLPLRDVVSECRRPAESEPNPFGRVIPRYFVDIGLQLKRWRSVGRSSDFLLVGRLVIPIRRFVPTSSQSATRLSVQVGRNGIISVPHRVNPMLWLYEQSLCTILTSNVMPTLSADCPFSSSRFRTRSGPDRSRHALPFQNSPSW